jgi:isopentenyl-diphosphate delta-isomerase
VSEERVVLLDPAGRAVGTAPKAEVHHGATPLHLAFSLYVFNDRAELLLTRRALTKATFPGLWTNSVCGHPGPGESVEAAAARRAREELGLAVTGLRLVLPWFGYRAELGGVVEHELCPVLAAWATPGATLSPTPEEVAQVRWVAWSSVVEEVGSRALVLSPWALEQVTALAALGPDPSAWPVGDPSLLPPAARTGKGG